MKNWILALLYFITYLTSFGQESVLKGRIVDNETNQPLPYATIEIFSLHTGTIANDNGDFEIVIDSLIIHNDTIIISHLGYNIKAIPIRDLLSKQDEIILLEASVISLDEIIVLPRNYKIVKLGITKKKPDAKQITNVYNNKIGNFIENKRGQDGWFKSVSYYIHTVGKPLTPFRVRIYEFDNEKRCPGKDLLTENLIVSAKGSGWFTIDLTEYNIPFPSNGAFIMMEWINSGKQYFYETGITTTNKNGERNEVIREFYGQSIGSVLKQPEMITWGITLGNEWIPYELYYKGYINAMINVEIAYLDK